MSERKQSFIVRVTSEFEIGWQYVGHMLRNAQVIYHNHSCVHVYMLVTYYIPCDLDGVV